MKFSIRPHVPLLWIVLIGYWMANDLPKTLLRWEDYGVPAELVALIYVFIFADIARCLWRGRAAPRPRWMRPLSDEREEAS
jgi:hypothetical protein